MTIHAHIDRRLIADFCDRWHVRELSVFGSVLRPDFSEQSDIDVLVEFDPEYRVTLFDLADMQAQLEALLGRDVDLVDKLGVTRSRNAARRTAILESAQVIHAA